MSMRIGELFRRVRTGISSAFGLEFKDEYPRGIRGDVFLTLTDSLTGEETKFEKRNLIVKDASILIARLMKDNLEPPKSCYVLAVGTGGVGWNLQAPPSPTDTQR